MNPCDDNPTQCYALPAVIVGEKSPEQQNEKSLEETESENPVGVDEDVKSTTSTSSFSSADSTWRPHEKGLTTATAEHHALKPRRSKRPRKQTTHFVSYEPPPLPTKRARHLSPPEPQQSDSDAFEILPTPEPPPIEYFEIPDSPTGTSAVNSGTSSATTVPPFADSLRETDSMDSAVAMHVQSGNVIDLYSVSTASQLPPSKVVTVTPAPSLTPTTPQASPSALHVVTPEIQLVSTSSLYLYYAIIPSSFTWCAEHDT